MCCHTPLTSLLVLGKVHVDLAAVDFVAIQVSLRAGRCRYVKVLAEAESLGPAGLPVGDDPARGGAGIVVSTCLRQMMGEVHLHRAVRTCRINRCDPPTSLMACNGITRNDGSWTVADAPEGLDWADFGKQLPQLRLSYVPWQVADCKAEE